MNIHLESCVFCKHNQYEDDCIASGYVCYGRKEMVGNLKSFPFRTRQKCFEKSEFADKQAEIFGIETPEQEKARVLKETSLFNKYDGVE